LIQRSSLSPVGVADVHDVLDFWSAFADERRQVLDVDAGVGTLAKVKTLRQMLFR